MPKPRIPTYAFVSGWIFFVVTVWLFGADAAPARQLPVLTVLAYFACWGGFFWFSIQSRRQKARRFVTVNMPLLIAVATAEACSFFGVIDYRLVFGRQVQPWENTQNLLDPDLIHIHRPHFHARGKLAGGDLTRWRNAAPTTNREYEVRYDHNGFRNRVDYSEADCIVIGDSFIEAGNVLSNELHTTLMAEALEWKVVNLGQSYYGPQQELIVLKRFGVAYQPKVCFWVFFEGNDLKDVWRYRDFVEGWPDSVANYYSWKDRSLTKNAFLWLGARYTFRESPSDVSSSAVLSTGDGTRQLWFGYAGSELSTRDLVALDVTVSTLKKAYRQCQKEGITLIVVFAPTKFRVYADICQFEEESVIQNWTVNNLPERLRERLLRVSNEIGFLDLTPEFRDAAEKGSLLYYADDTHWSPEGHSLAARSVCEFLRTRYMHLLSGS